MNLAPESIQKFSTGAFLIGTCLNFIGTVILAGMQFKHGMASFNQDSSSSLTTIDFLLWVWSPVAMILVRFVDNPSKDTLFGITVISACSFGLLFGYLIPYFRKRLERPLYP